MHPPLGHPDRTRRANLEVSTVLHEPLNNSRHFFRGRTRREHFRGSPGGDWLIRAVPGHLAYEDLDPVSSGLYADELFNEFRITQSKPPCLAVSPRLVSTQLPANNASNRAADSSCMPGRTCEYVSIVRVIDACPSIS